MDIFFSFFTSRQSPNCSNDLIPEYFENKFYGLTASNNQEMNEERRSYSFRKRRCGHRHLYCLMA